MRALAPWLILILGLVGITAGFVAWEGGWKALFNITAQGFRHGFKGGIFEHGVRYQNHTFYYNRTQQWTICACNKYTGVCRWFSQNALSNPDFQEHWEVVDSSKCSGLTFPGKRWRR